MHEFSLVESLIDEVIRAVENEANVKITEVIVECGPLSGVEPALLQFAFETMAPMRLGENCCLVIDEVKLRAICENCRSTISPNLHDFRCPFCGEPDVRVTQGEDLVLRTITLWEEDSIPASDSATSASRTSAHD